MHCVYKELTANIYSSMGALFFQPGVHCVYKGLTANIYIVAGGFIIQPGVHCGYKGGGYTANITENVL